MTNKLTRENTSKRHNIYAYIIYIYLQKRFISSWLYAQAPFSPCTGSVCTRLASDHSAFPSEEEVKLWTHGFPCRAVGEFLWRSQSLWKWNRITVSRHFVSHTPQMSTFLTWKQCGLKVVHYRLLAHRRWPMVCGVRVSPLLLPLHTKSCLLHLRLLPGMSKVCGCLHLPWPHRCSVFLSRVSAFLVQFSGPGEEKLKQAAATFCSNQPFALEMIKSRQKKDSRFQTFVQVS